MLVWLATPRLTTRMRIADAILASRLKSALPGSNELTFLKNLLNSIIWTNAMIDFDTGMQIAIEVPLDPVEQTSFEVKA